MGEGKVLQRSPTAMDDPLFKTSLSGNIRVMPTASGILQKRHYCLIEQLETMEDQGNNDVVIGVGQAARTGT